MLANRLIQKQNFQEDISVLTRACDVFESLSNVFVVLDLIGFDDKWYDNEIKYTSFLHGSYTILYVRDSDFEALRWKSEYNKDTGLWKDFYVRNSDSYVTYQKIGRKRERI